MNGEHAMSKEKKKADRKKKVEKKGSQLAIRVEKSERDAFVALCDRLDTSAAREIRRFMREFVTAHAAHDAPAKAAPAEAEAEAAAEAAPEPARRRKAAAEAPVG
jgi:hypothetical protein